MNRPSDHHFGPFRPTVGDMLAAVELSLSPRRMLLLPTIKNVGASTRRPMQRKNVAEYDFH
jgi:hypothetical protein